MTYQSQIFNIIIQIDLSGTMQLGSVPESTELKRIFVLFAGRIVRLPHQDNKVH